MKSNAYAMQPLAVAMAITNRNQNAAMLFFDLWSFLSYLKAKHQEQVLILTDEKLSERTGLSFNQTRRAKVFLVDNGLIHTWVKKNPKYHGDKTVTHIRIPENILALVEELKNGTMQICTVKNEQNHIGQTVQGCLLPIYIEKIKKSKAATNHGSGKQADSGNEEKLLAQLKEEFDYE